MLLSKEMGERPRFERIIPRRLLELARPLAATDFVSSAESRDS
jgi:hypothetical protein